MNHILYRTINIINNKYYIGVHRQEGIKSDGYLGSGDAIKAAIKKYGKENFIRKTLLVGPRALIYLMEKEFLKDKWMLPECYNMKPGGLGGHTDNIPWNKGKTGLQTWSEEEKQIRSIRMKELWSDPEWRENQTIKKLGQIPWNKGIPHSEETKRKIGLKSGRPRTQEQKDHLRKLATGRPRPDLIGKPNCMAGKTHKDETKKKMRKSSPNKKSILLNNTQYESYAEATRQTGLSWQQIKTILKRS